MLMDKYLHSSVDTVSVSLLNNAKISMSPCLDQQYLKIISMIITHHSIMSQIQILDNYFHFVSNLIYQYGTAWYDKIEILVSVETVPQINNIMTEDHQHLQLSEIECDINNFQR